MSAGVRLPAVSPEPDNAVEQLIAALTIADPAERLWRIREVLPGMSLEDFQRMPAVLSENSKTAGLEEVRAVMEAWAARDATAAVLGALTILQPGMVDLAVSVALETALPAHATEIADAMARLETDTPVGSELTQRVFDALLARDRSSALQWVLDLAPECPFRRDAIGSAAARLSRESMTGALSWVESNLGSADRADAMLAVAEVASPLTYPEVMRWMERLMPDENGVALASAMMQSWAHDDPQTAAQFIEEVKGDRNRERFVPAFAVGVATYDPATAMQWALSVGDTEVRRDAVTEVLHTWEGDEPGAVRRWFALSTDLPVDARTLLAETISREALPPPEPNPDPQ